MIRRSYSILSSPNQKDTIDFYVAYVPEGELTPRLFHLKNGDPIYIGPKITGRFTLEKVPEEKHLLLVSTGTGLTPYISMIRSQLKSNPNRKWIVLHGVREEADLSFDQELRDTQNAFDNLYYFPCVSRSLEKDSFYKGRVTDFIKSETIIKTSGLELTPENFDVLLCGNPAMIEELTSYFESLGFKKDKGKETGQIHTEEYW